MRILDRYLATAVINGTLMTLAVLLPLLGVFILADEINDIGINDYGLGQAMVFVTLSLPRYAYQVFPIATLIGALVGLGTLAGRSELVAMRAAGISIQRIVFGALGGGVVLALLAILIGEVVAPPAEQRALAMRSTAQTGDVMQLTASGFWARDGAAFVNIREIDPPRQLRGIYIYELDGTWLREALHAREARYVRGEWVLQDIRRSWLEADGVRIEAQPRAVWDSLINPGLLKVIVVEPHALPVWGLWRYVQFLQQSAQDAGRYQVAFWAKVVQPLLILAMIFVSIPVLLGSARSASLGTKVFVGIVLGIVFYLITRTFAYLALLYQMNAALAAIAPPLLFVLAAFWWLRRVG